MESPPNKVTVLLSGNSALSMNSDTARVPDHFANHMFGQFVTWGALVSAIGCRVGDLIVGFAADRPLGDVVGPFVRVNTSRGITISEDKKVDDFFGY